MTFTKPFNQLGKDDAAIAGGKGASLGEMTQAGIPVPPGFVILAGAFERFIIETSLTAEIDAILDKVDHREMHTVEHASETIQALILHAEVPADLRVEIEKSFKDLNTEFVAVRSSATAEDGAEAAWAGQLDTFLNTTHETLLEKVRECWASLFTPRAIFYRFEKGMDAQKISVAVVVQKMVNSDAAGIAFSVHPVTEDRNQMIIEAGFGLGEAVVSGQVTPDSYVVTKEPRSIIEKSISEQAQGIYRKAGGGNEWKELPKHKGSSRVLTDEQILSLAKVLITIEKHYGFPVDTEWAMENDELYIVQSRPITTLSNNEKIENSIVSTFLKEIKNDKLTLIEADFIPMFIVIDWLNYYDHDDSLKDIYPFFYYKNGVSSKVYLNLTKYHNIAKMMLGRYLDRDLDLHAWMQRYAAIEARINKTYASYFTDRISDEQVLLARLAEADAELREIVALTLFLDMFDRSNIQEVLEEKKLQIDLDRVWEAAEIQDFPSFDLKNKEDILHAIDNKEIGSLQYVFANYTSVPSVEEAESKANSYNSKDLLEEISHAKTQIKKNKALKEKAKLTLGSEEQKVLAFVDWSSSLRDQRKAAMNKCDALLFNVTTDLYELWSIDKSLVPVSFVFDTLKGKDHVLGLVDVIAKRKDKMGLIYYGKDRYFEDQDFRNSDLIELDTHYLNQNKSDDDNVIKGESACRGVVRGTVKVITTQSDFGKLKEGDILVTGMTRPEFVPLMKLASAIVTDEGGITSHAAIVSRELNKPCVIGTKIATHILQDNDEVEVDANKGIVRVLNKSHVDTIEFDKIYTRDTTIIMQEFWGQCCSGGLRERYGINNPHHPEIIHYMNQGSIEIWENRAATKYLMDAIYEKNVGDENFMPTSLNSFKNEVAELKTYWDKDHADSLEEFEDYIDKARNALTNFIPYYYSAVDDRTPVHLREMALEYRNEDFFFANSDTFIRNSLTHLYPEVKGFETSITTRELKNIPAQSELEARRAHMTLIDGVERTTETLAQLQSRRPELLFLQDKVEFSGQEIKGQIAYKGIVRGKVKLLRRRDQLSEVQEGDIIVSPMTTPDFLPAMEKAAAFVTDEGGITCHAGIVAREMKKPCIIGTKIATQVLNDGDEVEVDANNGIVRILKSNAVRHLSKEDINITDWEFEAQQRGEQPIFLCDLFSRSLDQLIFDMTGEESHYDYLFTDSDKLNHSPRHRDIVLKRLREDMLDRAKRQEFLRNSIEIPKSFNAVANKVEAKINDLISNKELAELWRDMDRDFLKVIPWFYYPWYVSKENMLTDQVKIGLEKHRKEIEKICDMDEALLAIVFPVKKTNFQLEQDEMLGLVTAAEMNPDFANDSTFKKLASEYLKKYDYLTTFILTPVLPMTYDQLVERVSQNVRESFKENYSLQKEATQKNEERARQILEVIKGDKEIMPWVEDSRELGYVLTAGIEEAYMSSARYLKFIQLVAERIGVTFEDTKYLLSNEIATALEEDKKIPAELINERRLGFVLMIKDGVQYTVFGKEGHELSVWIDSELNKVDTTIKEFTGQRACKGHAKGKVRIATTPSQAHLLKEGEILVCPMTNPDYVPAMRRSAAIITDEGGLLSHAAIMSREFGKPCVIATKIATQLLKTGDVVEVDADNGLVRILEGLPSPH